MKFLFSALLVLLSLPSWSNNSFYLNNYKVYGSHEEASFTLYNYGYRRDPNGSSIHFVMYSIKDPIGFFESGILRQYGQVIPDSLLQTLEIEKTWEEETKGTYNNQVTIGKLEPGVYVVEGIRNGEVAQIPIIVSDHSVIVRNTGGKAVAFMSHRESGSGIKGFSAIAYLNNTSTSPMYYKNATAIFDFGEQGINNYNYTPVVCVKGDDIAVTQTYFYNYYSNNTNEVGYMFTDRSAYRPEQWVKFKGVFRQKDGFGYKVKTDSIVYAIYNAQQEEVAKKKVGLDKHGSFNDSIYVEKSWKLGEYSIKEATDGNNYYYWYGYGNDKSCKFKVEEYKKPEYEVAVELDAPQYQFGDELVANISADYFFGAPVVNAKVSYKVVREPLYVPWYYHYRYWWWYEDLYGQDYYYGQQQVVHAGEGELDASGKLKITYQTKEKETQNSKYTIIAEVTDASRRVITGSGQSIVAYSAFNLSAASPKYYYHNDEQIRLEISALDFSRNKLETPVNVKLQKHIYKNNVWSDKQQHILDTTILTGEVDVITALLPSQEPGYYTVSLEATDKSERKVTQMVSVYVIDPEKNDYYWWSHSNNGSIQIMTDKKVYNSGEQIRAVFYVPAEADALITVNNDEFAHFDSYTFKGGESGSFKTLNIPVDRDAHGKFEIYIGYNKDNQYYSFRQNVAVIPENKYLNVSLTFDSTEYQPGQEATAILTVTDHEGRPIPNADITLSTADEAIYALYPDKSQDITKVFYNTDIQSYNYEYQNQFSRSASSQKIQVRGIEWRRKKLDLSIDEFFFLGKKVWYSTAYHSSKNKAPVVRGYIVDYNTGRPIGGGTIKLGNKKIKVNNDGYFALKGFKLSHATMVFTHEGKETTIENLPLYNHNDLDLFVAIGSKDHTVSLSNDPEVILLSDMTVVTGGLPANFDDVAEVSLEESEAADGDMMADAPMTVTNAATGSGGALMNASFGSISQSTNDRSREAGKLDKKGFVGHKREQNKDQQALVDPPATRSDFQDAIYWNPNLRTNGRGIAKVKIRLPDNLTTWRTFAKVITDRTEVGQTMAKITVTKNLLVRMETPRFMTLGDEMLIATTVHNYLDTEKEVTIELQSNGLSVAGTRQRITIEPNDDKRIDWKVNTKSITQAELTVKALTNEESDAMMVKVPVQPYGLEMIEAASLYLSNNDAQSMELSIPDDINMGSAAIELSTAPSVTAALLSSMDDLIGYPYGCVEQTMSRFLPNVIVAQTIRDLGKDYASTIDAEELRKMVAKGVERLGQLQHSDGGWGWWENDQTNPFMTAYVVNGLYMADKAGYDIPKPMLDQGKTALSSLISRKSMDETTYAYGMMVAAKTGMDLWSKRKLPDDANSYQLALWAQAAYHADDKEVADRMVKRLESAVIKSGTANHWGGKKFYYSWQDDKVETTANTVLALTLNQKNHPLVPGAVQWLMDQRKGNSWHNTRQTAMTIFGLNRVLRNDANPNLELEIYANDVLIDKIQYGAKDVFKTGKSYTLHAAKLFASTNLEKTAKTDVLRKHKNVIKVVQRGHGSLFVNAKLNYFLDDKHQMTEKQRENMTFEVSREYYKLVSKKKNGQFVYKKELVTENDFQSGDNILVKVKVHAKHPREYVLIEDPIPAGCEFIRDRKGYIVEEEPIYDGSGQYWNYRYWGYWNWNRWYSHQEFRDSKISHTVTNLPAGKYEYSYLMKAQIPGEFKVNPAVAQLMYYPESRGFSSFESFTIRE